MAQYHVNLIVDTESCDIDDSLSAVDKYVHFAIREAAQIDGDQIAIGKIIKLKEI
jgi:hypothetical protein